MNRGQVHLATLIAAWLRRRRIGLLLRPYPRLLLSLPLLLLPAAPLAPSAAVLISLFIFITPLA
jgi:hypothetical protein